MEEAERKAEFLRELQLVNSFCEQAIASSKRAIQLLDGPKAFEPVGLGALVPRQPCRTVGCSGLTFFKGERCLNCYERGR